MFVSLYYGLWFTTACYGIVLFVYLGLLGFTVCWGLLWFIGADLGLEFVRVYSCLRFIRA